MLPPRGARAGDIPPLPGRTQTEQAGAGRARGGTAPFDARLYALDWPGARRSTRASTRRVDQMPRGGAGGGRVRRLMAERGRVFHRRAGHRLQGDRRRAGRENARLRTRWTRSSRPRATTPSAQPHMVPARRTRALGGGAGPHSGGHRRGNSQRYRGRTAMNIQLPDIPRVRFGAGRARAEADCQPAFARVGGDRASKYPPRVVRALSGTPRGPRATSRPRPAMATTTIGPRHAPPGSSPSSSRRRTRSWRPQDRLGYARPLALCLYGILRPGDEMLAAAGKPYDTLEEVIGLAGEGRERYLCGTLALGYREVSLRRGRRL